MFKWTKCSPRTTSIQNTKEYLLLEVAAMQKIKMVPRVKDNIFIFRFSFQGTMKQTVKVPYGWKKKHFTFFKPSKHGIIVLHALRHYLRNICEISPNNNQIAKQ